MKVYTYVIVNDRGSAPNYEFPFVTLAVCKPLIRRTSAVGDLVLAFNGKALGADPHAVRWAGIVSEKLTFAQYWQDKRFKSKKPAVSRTPDNIYRPVSGELVQVHNTTHGPSNIRRDLRGQYVLVFERTWSFGDAEIALPASFGLHMRSRRGHRVVKLTDAKARRLLAWLDAEAPRWKGKKRSRRTGRARC